MWRMRAASCTHTQQRDINDCQSITRTSPERLINLIYPLQLLVKMPRQLPKNTPEIITELNPNEIFVYGSNQYAIHGAGSAKAAVDKFGAIYKDVPMGLCGQSYGIITKSSVYYLFYQLNFQNKNHHKNHRYGKN